MGCAQKRHKCCGNVLLDLKSMFCNIRYGRQSDLFQNNFMCIVIELTSLHETHHTDEFVAQIKMANSPNGNGRFVKAECARNTGILSQKHNAYNSCQT